MIRQPNLTTTMSHSYQKLTRLNLGSGPGGIEGWLNVDADVKLRARPFLPLLRLLGRLGIASRSTILMYEAYAPPPNLRPWNFARRPLPLPPDSMDAVFTSHTLEHFPRYIALRVVRDLHRVLRPGGILRVAVPDLEVACRRYLLSRGVPAPTLPAAQATPMTGREVNLLFYNRDHVEPTPRMFSVDYRLSGISHHMYIFDADDMFDLLHDAGFDGVTRRAYREGACPDLERLDTHPEVSLYVEARKPGPRAPAPILGTRVP